MHLNQLANQLQQLAENVANLQETNEESRAKSQQENLLAEVGDMKGYLELLVMDVLFYVF
jgi:DNA-binding protein YbaB